MDRSIRFRKVILTLWLLLSIILQPILHPFSRQNIVLHSKNNSMGNSVWMHIDTFFGQNQAQLRDFATTLKLGKIDNVFILAKNIDGTITYPSKVGLKCLTNNYMKSFVGSMKSNGIKVYFYFPINTDPLWIKLNPLDVAYQGGSKDNKKPIPDPAKKLVNLTSKNYRNYIISLMKEAVNAYSIDGVQLDYIRYTNGFFGFSKEELVEAKKRRIDTEKIIEYTYQTFQNPGDWKTLLNKYDDGDQNVLAWAKLREDIVFDFTQQIADSMKKINIQVGTTLVSSGANAKAYTAIHFGQSWERMSSVLDFATPMAYHGSRVDVEKFVEEICLGTISKINPSCKVAIGIQANETSTEKMMEAIKTVKKHHLNFILFRIGTFAFANYDFFPEKKEQTLFQLVIANNLEQKQIKGIEFKNTGNLVTFSHFPTDINLLSKDETKTCLVTSNPIKPGEIKKIKFLAYWKWEEAQSFLSPVLVLSDGKIEIPTLNIRNFECDQLLIDQNLNIVQYNGKILQNKIIKAENQKTWILISSLESIFGFKLEQKNSQFEIFYQKSKFVINQSEKKCFFQLNNREFIINEEIFFTYPNYLPLKEFMRLFRIFVSYNQQKNIISCSSLIRDVLCSSYNKMKDINPFELWITNSSEVLIDLEDLLNNSFYKEIYKLHLQGESVRIILKNDHYNISEIERIIQLIHEEKDDIFLPDLYCYFIQQNNDWKKVPIKREILTDNFAIYSGSVNKGYVSWMFVKQNYPSFLPDSTKGYYDMSNDIQDEIYAVFRNFPEYFSLKNLYFLSDSKF